jgi:hypothetical protein
VPKVLPPVFPSSLWSLAPPSGMNTLTRDLLHLLLVNPSHTLPDRERSTEDVSAPTPSDCKAYGAGAICNEFNGDITLEIGSS